jgi:hypothetical protein
MTAGSSVSTGTPQAVAWRERPAATMREGTRVDAPAELRAGRRSSREIFRGRRALREDQRGMVGSVRPDAEPGRLAELRTSARGWQGIQLAVLGFIGLCGVLQRGEPSDPMWLQVLAGVLVLGSLVLACVATYLIGRVAWPLYGARHSASAAGEPDERARASRDLTRGLLLTFAAVAMLALGAATAWWPHQEEDAGGLVEAQAAAGEWCGRLAAAQPGTLQIVTAQRPVVVPIQSLAALRPVDKCE